MEQENLKTLEVTLKELRDKVLNDEDIRGMFSKKFPEINFEEAVDRTLYELYNYALVKDYDVLTLSLQGAKLFFASVLSDLTDEDPEVEDEPEGDNENYGKA